MADPELEAIRKQRMAQMQSQYVRNNQIKRFTLSTYTCTHLQRHSDPNN